MLPYLISEPHKSICFLLLINANHAVALKLTIAKRLDFM